MKRGTSGIISQRLADFLNAGNQRGIADCRIRPDRLKELVLGDDLTGAARQLGDHGKRLWCQAQQPVAALEANARIKLEQTEPKLLMQSHFLSSAGSWNSPMIRPRLPYTFRTACAPTFCNRKNRRRRHGNQPQDNPRDRRIDHAVTGNITNVITDWNERAVAFVVARNMGPPPAERVLAMTHAAMFDAVNSIERKYRPYRFSFRPTLLYPKRRLRRPRPAPS